MACKSATVSVCERVRNATSTNQVCVCFLQVNTTMILHSCIHTVYTKYIIYTYICAYTQNSTIAQIRGHAVGYVFTECDMLAGWSGRLVYGSGRGG